MLPKDEELYRRVEEVVHYIWDPIGVCDIPQARDEYHSYMTALFSRVQAGNIEGILEYMKCVASDNMGLSFDEEKASEAAKVMLEWKSYIDENTEQKHQNRPRYRSAVYVGVSHFRGSL